MTDWDARFIGMARDTAGWSKDPSAKVGAVIVRPNKTIASVGFNGLPRRVKDTPERLNNREVKLAMVLHGEENAILHANEPLDGCTLYVVPFHPCAHCAAVIIQKNIARVVYAGETPARWAANVDLAASMFAEAGVEVIEFREGEHATPVESQGARGVPFGFYEHDSAHGGEWPSTPSCTPIR